MPCDRRDFAGRNLHGCGLFGNIPVVKQNFELVVIGIIGVSLLPIAVEAVGSWRSPGAERV